MTELSFQYDDEFQLAIFELMLLDTHFCEKAVLTLKPEYFRNEYYAYFFNTIKNLNEEYKSRPSNLQIKNEIQKLPPEQKEKYILIYRRITAPKAYQDHDYIRKNLTKFCKKAMNLQINETLRKNNNADPDYVNGLISKLIEEQKAIDFSSVNCQTAGQLDSILEKSTVDALNLVPTYLPSIDRALGGGVPKGTLTIGLSGTNVGKSIWLINWAYHLIKDGKKVFYVNLEGYELQTMLRLASRAIGAHVGDIRFNRLNDIELQKKIDFINKYKNSIQIFHNASFDFKLENLIPIIRQKKEEFEFDALMIDYIQILKTNQRYSELRHEQSYTHRAIASLASELDFAAISVAQGNRATQEKNQQGNGLIRMGDISECFEITRAAAQVLTLNRSDTDIENDTARILLDKQREGRTGIIEVCKTNFARMAFYGDHTEGLGYMNMSDYNKTK